MISNKSSPMEKWGWKKILWHFCCWLFTRTMPSLLAR